MLLTNSVRLSRPEETQLHTVWSSEHPFPQDVSFSINSMRLPNGSSTYTRT
jgi:hypothetical protein